jgi:hypothetical protein
MIKLRNKESGELLGSISEEQLQFLIDNLEEETPDDTDYYLNRSTLEMLREIGADKSLMEILERSLGDRDDVEIVWSKT